MKKIIIILLFFTTFIQLACGNKTNKKSKSMNQASEQIEFVGRLININFNIPNCGTFHFGSVAVYDNIEIIKGNYDLDQIFIIHGCTEMAREYYGKEAGNLKKFVIGEYHKITAHKKNNFQIGSVFYGKIPMDRNYLYYAQKTDGYYNYSKDDLLQLTVTKPIPEKFHEALKAIQKSQKNPQEFYIQFEMNNSRTELIFHLWHESAFLQKNRNITGNPGGKCKDVYYNLKQKKVTKTYFWQ